MVEFGTPAFWVALVEIIGINIVLSGDNAVVIALAARSLPPPQQKQAIFWGSGAAVAMRIVLTIVAVELLKLPVLKLIGACLLVWIAVQLLLPEGDDGGDGGAETGVDMMAAIRTILVADLVMSLDNVIGVAAAAKGSVTLLIIGLAISIPLVIFASTLLLKVMERFPVIVTVGAGLLGFVAGEMAVTDPLVAEWIDAQAHWLHNVVPVAGVVLVIGLGRWLAARADAREEAEPVVELAASAAPPPLAQKLLLPIDGSAASGQAIDRLLQLQTWYRDSVEIHLLNVQHALHKDVGQFVGSGVVSDYHREQGLQELAAARERLDHAGFAYQFHVTVGDRIPEAIAHFAREHGIGQIFMATHGRSAVGEMLLGSVAKGVLQHSDIPVVLVR